MEELIIQNNDAGQRLDKFLGKTFPSLTKGAMYKAIRNKKIKVNRRRAQFDQQLMEGDHILLFLPPDLLARKSRKLQPVRDLDIVYDDENLIAVNKPAGLLSVKDSANDQDTLNDRILSVLALRGEYDPQAEQSFTPSVAHRLDRNTSGLVLAGKNAETARDLARSIRDHSLAKSYLAITQKKPVQGKVTLFIKKEGTRALVSRQEKEGYLPAVMSIRTIDEKNGLFLSDITLETGRFHQIRASLSFLGTPLVNDRKYSGQGDGRYQLQAWKIENTDPESSLPERIVLPEDQRLSL